VSKYTVSHCASVLVLNGEIMATDTVALYSETSDATTGALTRSSGWVCVCMCTGVMWRGGGWGFMRVRVCVCLLEGRGGGGLQGRQRAPQTQFQPVFLSLPFSFPLSSLFSLNGAIETGRQRRADLDEEPPVEQVSAKRQSCLSLSALLSPAAPPEQHSSIPQRQLEAKAS